MHQKKVKEQELESEDETHVHWQRKMSTFDSLLFLHHQIKVYSHVEKGDITVAKKKEKNALKRENSENRGIRNLFSFFRSTTTLHIQIHVFFTNKVCVSVCWRPYSHSTHAHTHVVLSVFAFCSVQI